MQSSYFCIVVSRSSLAMHLNKCSFFLSFSVFEVSCQGSSKILKECPPRAGPIVLPAVDLGPIFKAVYDKIGFLSFIGNVSFLLHLLTLSLGTSVEYIHYFKKSLKFRKNEITVSLFNSLDGLCLGYFLKSPL